MISENNRSRRLKTIASADTRNNVWSVFWNRTGGNTSRNGTNGSHGSGRMRTWEANPRRFAKSLLRDIERNFPALGKIEAASIWRGTLGRTVHRMPQIGEVERGLWVASGFGGHGLNTTAMAGQLVARGMVDADQTWRLFAPYALVWAGGGLGRALVQGAYWARETGHAAAHALARRRERRRERKAAQTPG